MSKDDLMDLLGSSSHHALYDSISNKINQAEIINIYFVDNSLLKIGSGSKIKKKDIIDITTDYITIRFDSHITDYMYSAIKRIEYY